MVKRSIAAWGLCLLLLLGCMTGTAAASEADAAETIAVEEVEPTAAEEKTSSVNKIFGGFMLASVLFLIYGSVSTKKEPKNKKSKKKKK